MNTPHQPQPPVPLSKEELLGSRLGQLGRFPDVDLYEPEEEPALDHGDASPLLKHIPSVQTNRVPGKCSSDDEVSD